MRLITVSLAVLLSSVLSVCEYPPAPVPPQPPTPPVPTCPTGETCQPTTPPTPPPACPTGQVCAPTETICSSGNLCAPAGDVCKEAKGGAACPPTCQWQREEGGHGGAQKLIVHADASRTCFVRIVSPSTRSHGIYKVRYDGSFTPDVANDACNKNPHGPHVG